MLNWVFTPALKRQQNSEATKPEYDRQREHPECAPWF
jgi:hypothetical protein